MSKKICGIRAEPEVMGRLKVLSARVKAPMGDVLKRLIRLSELSTVESKAMCQLLDSDECGELVSGDESEAEYIARIREESDTKDNE